MAAGRAEEERRQQNRKGRRKERNDYFELFSIFQLTFLSELSLRRGGQLVWADDVGCGKEWVSDGDEAVNEQAR